jgi:hypothetical protein
MMKSCKCVAMLVCGAEKDGLACKATKLGEAMIYAELTNARALVDIITHEKGLVVPNDTIKN